eukprot:656018-Prorocentrum_minimum.AAC.1
MTECTNLMYIVALTGLPAADSERGRAHPRDPPVRDPPGGRRAAAAGPRGGGGGGPLLPHRPALPPRGGRARSAGGVPRPAGEPRGQLGQRMTPLAEKILCISNTGATASCMRATGVHKRVDSVIF